MRAAIYARVSSAAQRDAHTIESQLRVLRAYVAAQGWTAAGEYIDDGRSAKAGKLDRREAFAALVAAAGRGAFDLLVVTDIDRLTRTDNMQERAAILGPFQAAGIRIVTPSGGELDLRTLLGELYVTMQAIVAAEENRKRAERIKAGKLRAIAEGRKPAGPTPFGLAYSRATGAWSIDETTAPIVREIFRRVAGGEACSAIGDDFAARDLPSPRSGWSREPVYRIVRSRTAVGEWDADKARGAVVRVPAMVTEDEYNAAQLALLRHKRRGLHRTRHLYLLEGLAICGHCGARIGIRSKSSYVAGGERRYNPSAYVCDGRRKGRGCAAPIVKTAELDARVWAALSLELEDPDLVDVLAASDAERVAEARDWAGDAATHRAHLERLQKHELAMIARARRGLVSEGALDAELANVARERKAVRDQLATAERAIAASTDEQTRLRVAGSVLEALRDALVHAETEDRCALLRELVRDGGVVIADGRARLDLRLRRRAGSSAAPVLAVAPDVPAGYRTASEAIGAGVLRLRLVA